MGVEVKIIKQLTDNYCYIIYSTETNEALILDPAEPNPIIDYLNTVLKFLQSTTNSRGALRKLCRTQTNFFCNKSLIYN